MDFDGLADSPKPCCIVGGLLVVLPGIPNERKWKMTTTKKAATENEGEKRVDDSHSSGLDDLLRKHGDAMREAVEKVKGIEVILNACAESDTIGQHIYSKRMFFVMDDVLFEACKELDGFLSAAGW